MRYYGDEVGNSLPADLEKTNASAAASASSTSKDSYTKKVKLALVKGKEYRFLFTYKHENPDTKEVKESDYSPVWKEKYEIPNLTKAVLNLTLTQGYKSYGVKFDLDPLSVHEDIVIYESLTSTSLGNEVYRGTSTNVTIPTNSIATRWITVRTRDKWDDLNKTDTGPLSVTPLNPDPDTSTPPSAPTGVAVSGSIDIDDKSGFSGKLDVSWTASTDTNTAGYVIRWSTQNPSVVTNPLWEYGQVDGKATTKFTVTGLLPNTLYYYQVTAKSPYNAISWTSPSSGTFGPIVDTNAPADVWAQIRSVLSVGGKTADLFKIGTGIAQSINTSTTITPTQTAGTYSGIILNKSTTNFGHNYWLNTGQFRVGSSSAFLYWDGSDLYTTGKINATGGSFTGDVKLDGGTLFAGANANSGQRVRLNSSGIFAYKANGDQTFSLDTAGYMNATSGLIGGWNLGATTLSNNGVVLDSTAGQISVGSAPSNSVYLSSTGNFRMWAGAQTPTDAAAKFKIGSDGVLYAQGAVIGLGAGSTGPFATAADLTGFLTASSLSGYATTNDLAKKNSTFAQDNEPTATKIGDIWIDTDAGNILKTWNGSQWTTRTDTTYAKTADLSTKLEAGGFLVAQPGSNQITDINSNGIRINSDGFKILQSAPATGQSMVLINSAGIAAYDSTGATMFAINSNGNAVFNGNISGASGTFSGPVRSGLPAAGQDPTSAYFDTQGSLGGVSQGLVIGAIGFKNTSVGGWTSHCYPYMPGSPNIDLGTQNFRWNDVRISGNVMVGHGGSDTAGATTGPKTKINSNGTIYANTLGTVANATTAVQGYVMQDNSGYFKVFTGSSSIRYKENVETYSVSSYSNIINNMRIVTYNYKPEFTDTPEIKSLGLIAEEVAEHEESEYLVGYKDGDPEKVHYSNIPLYLVGAFKEMSDKINTLQSRLDALEG